MDLILTRSDQTLFCVVMSDIDNEIFDHYAVRFALPLPTKQITYRRMKAIDVDEFASDLQNSRLFSLETDDVDVLAETYNSVLCEVLGQHSPLKSKTITVHHVAPWYTDVVRDTKTIRRKAERKWRQTRLVIHKQIYQAARDNVTALIGESKEAYYKDRI